MPSYKQDTCNIPGCEELVYEHHMCQKHYEFYSVNPLTVRFMTQEKALEDGTAGWKLKLKVVLQSIIHHAQNLPMPLISHFPLEHVFLGELYSLSAKKAIDRKRIEQVIADFDIPENENIADMRRVLNIRDIETSELGPKENYLLGRKDLPSMWPILISVVGFIFLYCFYDWIVSSDIQIRGAGLAHVEAIYRKCVPLGYALAVFVLFGILMPYQYNFFIERCYNMALYKRVEDNADVVNQVKFVKERRARSGSYYWSLYGVATGVTTAIFWSLLGGDTKLSWSVAFLGLAISMAIVPLLYSFKVMALYYPVVESMKRKRVAIDLYNADHRGGLSRFHRFLYLTFLYNEGVSIVLVMLYSQLPISKWWLILLIPMLLLRFNHAGWALVAWIRSIVDFNKEKHAEQRHLIALEGSTENMSKMELLGKTYPIGIIPILLFLVGSIIIPYVVNQLPQLSDLIENIGK